jgi:hypothetical protein
VVRRQLCVVKHNGQLTTDHGQLTKGTLMSQDNNVFNPFDPSGMLKCMRDANMDAWSKMMIQLVNTEAYAKATGTMLDTWLSSSTPFHKAMEAALTHIITNQQMTSRADILRLERFAAACSGLRRM